MKTTCTNLANTGDAFLVKRRLLYEQRAIKSVVANSPLLIFLQRQSRWMQDHFATLYYTLFRKKLHIESTK